MTKYVISSLINKLPSWKLGATLLPSPCHFRPSHPSPDATPLSSSVPFPFPPPLPAHRRFLCSPRRPLPVPYPSHPYAHLIDDSRRRRRRRLTSLLYIIMYIIKN